MRRTQEEAAATRQAILGAALKVFSAKGYAATRLEDVAQAAGVTRGAVYWHFQNKAGLYNSMVTEVAGQGFIRVLSQAAEEGGDFLDIFRRMCIRVLEMVERDEEMRMVMELISYKIEEASPELADVFRIRAEEMQTILAETARYAREGVEQGVFRSDLDPMDMAIAWQSMRDGMTRLWLRNPRAFSLAEKAPTIVDMFLQGIVASNKK